MAEHSARDNIIDALFSVGDGLAMGLPTALRKLYGAALVRSSAGQLADAVNHQSGQEHFDKLAQTVDDLLREFAEFKCQWEAAQSDLDASLAAEDAALFGYLYDLMFTRERAAGERLMAHWHISYEDLTGQTQVPQELLEESLDALDEAGYVKVHRSNMGIHTVVLKMRGIHEYAQHFEGDYARKTALVLIEVVAANGQRNGASNRKVAKKLGLSPILVLAIFEHFERHGGLKLRHMTGGVTLATSPAVWLLREVRRVKALLQPEQG